MEGSRKTPAEEGRRMAGWVFVSILLATATLLAAVTGRPLWLVVALAVITVVSTAAGARLRPDRQTAERDTPRG